MVGTDRHLARGGFRPTVRLPEVLLCLAALAVLAGCNGGGSDGSPTSQTPATTETGSVHVRIAWPQRGGVATAEIPAETQSIRVAVEPEGGVSRETLIVYPATEGTVADVPCGYATLRVHAFASTDGSGPYCAWSRAMLVVRGGTNEATGLSLIPGDNDAIEPVAPDGSTLVYVVRGEFVMGGGESFDIWGGYPAHRVRITKGFWLGKHEVTNAQFAAFLNANGSNADGDGHVLMGLDKADCGVEESGGVYSAKAGLADHPARWLTWYGARAYCDHYGLELPTEAQWEYASRGPRSLDFPWGNEWDPTKCCCWDNRGPHGDTWPVGSFPSGASWCGALDMYGNVWEQCQDFSEFPYTVPTEPMDDPTGPVTGDWRIWRGGGWTLGPSGLRHRGDAPPDELNQQAGFRVARPL